MAASEWIAIVSIALTLLLTLGGAGTAAYVKVVARLTRIETNQIWDRKVSKRMEKFLDMLAARGPKLAALGLVLWFAPQKAQGCFTYAHKLAVDDLARQTPYQQYVSVYFWLGDVPKSERPAFILTFAGWLHALSKEPSLASFPQVVAADNSLLRIDYTRYRWTPELMQKLHKAHPFNTQVLTVASPPVPFVGGGRLADGKEDDLPPWRLLHGSRRFWTLLPQPCGGRVQRRASIQVWSLGILRTSGWGTLVHLADDPQ
jgi:hypothetical protein